MNKAGSKTPPHYDKPKTDIRVHLVRCGAIIIGLLMSACTLTKPPIATQILVLNPTFPASAKWPYGPNAQPLQLLEIEAPRLLQERKIIFARDEISRGWYRHSEWDEPLPDKLLSILETQLEASGAFPAILDATQPKKASWKLQISLDSCYHDVREEPGKVILKVRAKLYPSPEAGNVQIAKTFTVKQPVVSFDAHGAVLGINNATAELVASLTKWVIEETRSK